VIDWALREERGRMRGRTVQIAFAAAVIVAGVVAFFMFQVFSGDTPPEAALSSPSVDPSVNSSGNAGRFAGTWSLDTSSGSFDDGSSTFAGYRVEEELSTIGTHEAVGRTPGVSGSMTLSDTQVTALDVTVDTTTLASDDGRRDNQLRERGLETDAFPTVTFSLTEPIDVGTVPDVGDPVEGQATGDLTLHGVTQRVTVPVQAQWTGERIEIAGSIDIAIADTGSRNRRGSSCCRSRTPARSSSTCSSSKAEVGATGSPSTVRSLRYPRPGWSR
jgi:polyisoprenoid-binding protein YceI